MSIASETKMRKRAADIVGDNLVVEKVALTFSRKEGGEEVRLKPYGYIPDIWAQIVQLLEENERYLFRAAVSGVTFTNVIHTLWVSHLYTLLYYGLKVMYSTALNRDSLLLIGMEGCVGMGEGFQRMKYG